MNQARVMMTLRRRTGAGDASDCVPSLSGHSGTKNVDMLLYWVREHRKRDLDAAAAATAEEEQLEKQRRATAMLSTKPLPTPHHNRRARAAAADAAAAAGLAHSSSRQRAESTDAAAAAGIANAASSEVDAASDTKEGEEEEEANDVHGTVADTPTDTTPTTTTTTSAPVNAPDADAGSGSSSADDQLRYYMRMYDLIAACCESSDAEHITWCQQRFSIPHLINVIIKSHNINEMVRAPLLRLLRAVFLGARGAQEATAQHRDLLLSLVDHFCGTKHSLLQRAVEDLEEAHSIAMQSLKNGGTVARPKHSVRSLDRRTVSFHTANRAQTVGSSAESPRAVEEHYGTPLRVPRRLGLDIGVDNDDTPPADSEVVTAFECPSQLTLFACDALLPTVQLILEHSTGAWEEDAQTSEFGVVGIHLLHE